ncbi:Tyrosine recombinase XerC [Rickettsiales endosymbiont of Paramecium tredecaurelia]|uniref:tyrosine-type recombinase/integrase n=1 Tax=Candidatus Sarmatiella mevalonica TaxID=2770581 RepID=UPI0019250F07|nr:tyrosine-type recombinase/integrase [Candidatus Sarmatiella mevalonica]MBL3284689.1 Tyrosine recombinase XerC [Candidatus Sarmatiella mevalonica]
MVESLHHNQLQEVLSKWMGYLKHSKRYGENTTNSYHRDVKHFLNFLSDYTQDVITLDELAKIDALAIRSWLAKRVGVSYQSTSNARSLSALRSFYKFLDTTLSINCPAIFAVKFPKKHHHLFKALEIKEIEEVIALQNQNVREPWVALRNKALILLLYTTGMRISEALSIKKKELNEYIKVTGKRSKQRLLPLMPEVREVIEASIALTPNPYNSEYVFLGQKGKKLHRGVFAASLLKLRHQSNLPKHLSAHAFRHSCATHLLDNEADLRSIQELLGHASLSTTQVYTKVSKRKIIESYLSHHPMAKK